MKKIILTIGIYLSVGILFLTLYYGSIGLGRTVEGASQWLKNTFGQKEWVDMNSPVTELKDPKEVEKFIADQVKFPVKTKTGFTCEAVHKFSYEELLFYQLTYRKKQTTFCLRVGDQHTQADFSGDYRSCSWQKQLTVKKKSVIVSGENTQVQNCTWVNKNQRWALIFEQPISLAKTKLLLAEFL